MARKKLNSTTPLRPHEPEGLCDIELLLGNTRLRKNIETLAKESQRDSKVFHQTRPPFTRLRDILEPIQAERSPSHPSHCQATDCTQELDGQFFRRNDGYVLCPACYAQLPPAP